jgi:hypothetical protein
MKKCVTCGQYKQDDEFNFKVRLSGLRQPWCRDCQHGHQRTWYEKHTEQEKEREYVYQYLSTHPCVKCGEIDPVVLEFDHIRGKAANVGTLITSGCSLERLKLEISLCQVLCSNCHRKKTAEEYKWSKRR